MESYVYQLRVEDQPLPFYVGKGKGNRAMSHMQEAQLRQDKNLHKANTIRKAEREGKKVLVEYLSTDLSDEEALRQEMFFISAYGRKDSGLGCLTNMTDGGDGASGYRHTNESKAKISKWSANQPPFSDETINKLRLKNLGELNPRYKADVSAETRQLISESHSCKWKVVLPDGSEILVTNLKSFCILNNLTVSAMYNVAKGVCRHHKQYRCWRLTDIQ